jgi:hypothetical protein
MPLVSATLLRSCPKERATEKIAHRRLARDTFTNIAGPSSMTDANPVTYDQVTINGKLQ